MYFLDCIIIFNILYYLIYIGIQEGDEVLVESYASIKHLLTGRWLHLDKKSKCFN